MNYYCYMGDLDYERIYHRSIYKYGVVIIGLTRGRDTKFHHTEKLDKGEAYIAQFTEITSAIKVRGKAKIYTDHGVIQTD